MTDPWPLRSSLELGALSTAVPCACLHVKHVLWEWGLSSLAESAELRDSDPQPPQTKGTNDDGASHGTDGVLLVAALSTRWNWYLTEEPPGKVVWCELAVGHSGPPTQPQTAQPRMVEPADLDKANGRMAAGQILGFELAGPAAGGWLFGVAAVLPFTVNAGTLGIAVFVLYVVKVLHQPPGAYGLLIAVGVIGGLAASATSAALTRRIGPWRTLLAAGLGVAVTQAALGLTSSVIGIRAPMLIGAGPIVIVTIGVAWRHHRRETDDAADAAPSEAS